MNCWLFWVPEQRSRAESTEDCSYLDFDFSSSGLCSGDITALRSDKFDRAAVEKPACFAPSRPFQLTMRVSDYFMRVVATASPMNQSCLTWLIKPAVLSCVSEEEIWWDGSWGWGKLNLNLVSGWMRCSNGARLAGGDRGSKPGWCQVWWLDNACWGKADWCLSPWPN